MRHDISGSLSNQLAERIERDIVQGVWRPGQRMPPEREWAQSLGVSRSVLREAMSQLADRGLVQRRHGSGSYVSEQPDARRADPWSQLLLRQPLMQKDLLEFREMLEIRCAELAAERANDQDLALLEQRLAQVNAAYSLPGREQQVAADVAFHRAVAEAAHNPVFSYLVGTLLELLHQHVRLSIIDLAPDSEESLALCQQHSALLAAIRCREGSSAADAARAHIGFVQKRWQRLTATENSA